MDRTITDAEARRVSQELEARLSSRAALPTEKPGARAWAASLIALGLVAGGIVAGPRLLSPHTSAPVAPPPHVVGVSTPLERAVANRLEFLGQFSAVQNVELRAQVGGTLTEIGFIDGDIVRKGDLLFQIDPTPYEIRQAQAAADVQGAKSRLDLATRELYRANSLSQTGAGSVQSADQKAAEQRAAQAALDRSVAAVRDAQFDLDHTRITAPFTGRIGSHQVSIGNLVSGSRAGSSPTTLLATIVSTDTIYLDFDMSEADYMAFLRHHRSVGGKLADKVDIALADETNFTRPGTLDFVSNTLDRASGTIHARATVPDPDGLMTPGGFARLRLDISSPAPALLVPDASVLPDQSQHIVLTVDDKDVVTPKHVQIGDIRDGLRVIRDGLIRTDRVIVTGIPIARPGSTVAPQTEAIKLSPSQNGGAS